jgi:outer membrane immunogenic protein
VSGVDLVTVWGFQMGERGHGQAPIIRIFISKCRVGVLSLLGGVALATLTVVSAASAADLYAPPVAYLSPPFSWTGFYVGANLGGGWANGSLNDNFTGASVGTGSSGVVGGGKAGYNYQIGNFVLGAEWDFEGSSLNATRSAGVLQGSANTNWITTVAGRFGIAANNLLYYGKAGGGSVGNSASVTNLATGASVSSSNTNAGWLVGAGVEWAFAPRWSASLEYNYLGLNTWNVNSTVFAPAADRFSVNRNVQTLLVGVNYRF